MECTTVKDMNILIEALIILRKVMQTSSVVHPSVFEDSMPFWEGRHGTNNLPNVETEQYSFIVCLRYRLDTVGEQTISYIFIILRYKRLVSKPPYSNYR